MKKFYKMKNYWLRHRQFQARGKNLSQVEFNRGW